MTSRLPTLALHPATMNWREVIPMRSKPVLSSGTHTALDMARRF